MDTGVLAVPLLTTILKSVARPVVGPEGPLHEIIHEIALPTRGGLFPVQLSDEATVGMMVKQDIPRYPDGQL